MVIQDATSGRDTLAKSQTGSGKTLGFAIPIVEQLAPEDTKHPAALILVPDPRAGAAGQGRPRRHRAREAPEDEGGLRRHARHASNRKASVDAHILIATPGRLQDLADRKLVKLDGVKIFVLDEADRMLDMGFQPQVDRIVRLLPKNRQTMFFSATLDGAVGRIADVYTKNPVRHEIVSDGKTVEEADHRFVPAGSHEKLEKLVELVNLQEGLTLVFVNTKRRVESLARQLRAQDVPTVMMHGDMTQQAREKALQRFEDKHVGVLVATDVAARGLDLDDITLVVNYDPPLEDKGYVHRVGRTARAGRAGMSVTFVTPDQQGDVSRMAARLDLHEEFEQEGMKVAPLRDSCSVGPAADGGRASAGRSVADAARDRRSGGSPRRR